MARTASNAPRLRRWAPPVLVLAGAGLAVIGGVRSGGSPKPPPSTPEAPSTPSQAKAAAPAVPASRLRLEIVATYPHDPRAYTQGLVEKDGVLFESTGLYGASSVRRVELSSGKVLAETRLSTRLFGEGLALVGELEPDRPGSRGWLVQLTWQEGKALLWDPVTLIARGEHAYEGEGWGLCFDGKRLVMSDGTDLLTFRDAETFGELSRLQVTRDGVAVDRLNELECVGKEIYANRWGPDEIVRIEAATGRVTASIDASGLLSPAERAVTDVLNGIAYRPGKGTFLITGKLWPKLFEVRFVPAS